VLKADRRHGGNAGFLGKIISRPIEQGTGSTQLSR